MEVMTEISGRYSPNSFSDEEIEGDKIDALIEAARRAPSSFNNQPWRYVFVSRNESSRKDLENSLALPNSWAKKASHLVVVFAREKDDKPYNKVPYHIYDSGLSAMSLVLEAEHQCLKCHQMAGFDPKKVRLALGIPEEYDVLVIIAVGYENKKLKISEKVGSKIKEKIIGSKNRKPFSEIAYFGKFKD